MERHRTRRATIILKKNKMGGIILYNIKAYYIATAIKTVGRRIET